MRRLANARSARPLKRGSSPSDAATPDAATPDAATPGTATPGTATPGTATPGTATQGAAIPGTVTPGTATPGATTPGAATPGTAFIATELSELERYEDAWRELAVRRGSAHLTPEFFRAWIDHYGEHAQPYVPIAIDEGGALLGLLPLVITRDALRQVQVAGADFWMALPLPAIPEHERRAAGELAALLAARRGDWRALTLDHIVPSESWCDPFSRSLLSAERGRLIEKRVQHPWLTVDLSAGWEGYLAGKRSKFKHELHRAERRLHEAHAVVSREAATPAQAQADLENLFRLHSLRRDTLGGSMFDSPAMRGTLASFAMRAQQQGWLRLRSLELDGEVAAVNLGFRVGDRFSGYVLAWEPSLAKLGIGRLVLVDALRAAAAEGVQAFDMGVGHSEMKARHATHISPAETLWAYTPRTAALFALRRAGRHLLPDGVRRSLGQVIRAPASRIDMPS